MGYGTVSRLFHWITVLIVLVMIPVGLVMTQEIPRSVQDPLFILHKGLGSVLIVVVLLRLGWRLTHQPPPLPEDIPLIQRRAAATVHVGLYVFLLVQGISGYVRVTTGGFPIELLDSLGISPLFSKDEEVAKIAKAVHANAIVVLALLLIAHVAAAAYHGLIRRDGVFSRMWPPI